MLAVPLRKISSDWGVHLPDWELRPTSLKNEGRPSSRTLRIRSNEREIAGLVKDLLKAFKSKSPTGGARMARAAQRTCTSAAGRQAGGQVASARCLLGGRFPAPESLLRPGVGGMTRALAVPRC